MTATATLFIEGDWLPASSGQHREIHCPADGPRPRVPALQRRDLLLRVAAALRER